MCQAGLSNLEPNIHVILLPPWHVSAQCFKFKRNNQRAIRALALTFSRALAIFHGPELIELFLIKDLSKNLPHHNEYSIEIYNRYKDLGIFMNFLGGHFR